MDTACKPVEDEQAPSISMSDLEKALNFANTEITKLKSEVWLVLREIIPSAYFIQFCLLIL